MEYLNGVMQMKRSKSNPINGSSSNVPIASSKVKGNGLSAKTHGLKEKPSGIPKVSISWQVGDAVHHDVFGDGVVTNLLGEGAKAYIAVAFPGIGKKILDPRLAPIQKV